MDTMQGRAESTYQDQASQLTIVLRRALDAVDSMENMPSVGLGSTEPDKRPDVPSLGDSLREGLDLGERLVERLQAISKRVGRL